MEVWLGLTIKHMDFTNHWIKIQLIQHETGKQIRAFGQIVEEVAMDSHAFCSRNHLNHLILGLNNFDLYPNHGFVLTPMN